jgi:hypothetical protein
MQLDENQAEIHDKLLSLFQLLSFPCKGAI